MAASMACAALVSSTTVLGSGKLVGASNVSFNTKTLSAASAAPISVRRSRGIRCEGGAGDGFAGANPNPGGANKPFTAEDAKKDPVRNTKEEPEQKDGQQQTQQPKGTSNREAQAAAGNTDLGAAAGSIGNIATDAVNRATKD